MNLLNATLVLATTPGLDVYQWKRSKDVKWYVHMQHGANEMTTYRMFGMDYYDGLLVSGQYQIDDTRALEKLRNIGPKEMVLVGIPYMDDIVNRLKKSPAPAHETTVLVAPSWGESTILRKFGGRIIEVLLATGYHIIIRPHPQSYITEMNMLEPILKAYPASDQLEWNTDLDNFDVMNRSDILISDFPARSMNLPSLLTNRSSAWIQSLMIRRMTPGGWIRRAGRRQPYQDWDKF